MNHSINKIKELFEQYGYQLDRVPDSRILVFSLKSSMYPAVEIVPVKDIDNDQLNTLQREYSNYGFAVNICNKNDIDEIENYLFDRFFNIEASNKRIIQLYEDYTEELMSLYDKKKEDYRYIPIPYSLEKNFEVQQSGTSSLTSSILEILNSNGPQFVIIEAAAGYGKTSTAYELLKEYVNQQKLARPFLMELFKERRANTFRYLLLSQIQRNFTVALKEDVVIHNIKKGRIPLIIDGFDELLSKDLDNGAMDAKFDDIETMLSTIGELLTDNSKVILTTRKTAIFSGSSFYDWYVRLSKNTQFTVSRYQLYSPSINDWLTTKDLTAREIRAEQLEHIANPVLLAYLRYCTQTFKDSESLVQQYFDFLLKREITRQEIPLSKSEQLEIFQKLSTYFSGFNITSEKRSEVKDIITELSKSYIKNYTNNSKETENIINALTNHALLDRKEEKIGFLNDFVFGFLLMEAFINYSKEEDIIDFLKETPYSFLDKSLTTARVRCDKSKKNFWEALQEHPSITNEQTFRLDLLLTGKTQHNLAEHSFSSETFTDCQIGTPNSNIKKCTFASMNFKSCVFDLDFIEDTTFIECIFNDCEFKETTHNSTKNHFWYCTGIPECDSDFSEIENTEKQESSDIDLAIRVLESYFQVDKQTRQMRSLSRQKEDLGIGEKAFKKIINLMKAKKYILVNGDKSFISDDGARYYFEQKHE